MQLPENAWSATNTLYKLRRLHFKNIFFISMTGTKEYKENGPKDSCGSAT